jgi:hypothetical protein
MKRVQLIEIGILSVALICGYKFFESLISTIITTLYQFTYGYPEPWTFIFQYLIFTAIYFTAFFLLIKYCKWIADYIDKKGQQPITDAESDTINISLQQSSLLFIILVAVCLITLIAEIPVILISVYNYFKKEAGGLRRGSVDDLNFKSAAIKFIFTLIILFYARSISSWFSRQSDKPIVKTHTES